MKAGKSEGEIGKTGTIAIVNCFVYSRIRMCSTGPETTPFASPARLPEMNSCPLPRASPSGPPRPARTFCAAKKRFAYSSAPNWIETHAPMPRSGVSVPWGA